ncbi:MAG: hypothetical protein Kow0031_15910 [Anaerolineae bacterium]
MSKHRPRLDVDALIFACDDILINVQHSYRAVVQKTVQLYLEQALGLAPSKLPLLTLDEVLLLQKRGNFSDFWELAEALVMYFVEMLPPVPAPTFPSKFHVPAIMAYLQFAGGNLRVSIDSLRQRKDIAQFAEGVVANGGGLEGANQALPRENRHMLVSSGSVTKTNIVGRIFQELYLGAEQFEQAYRQPAVITHSSGYAEHESPVMDVEILRAIGEKAALAVVSSHPRTEVERSLRTAGLTGAFQVVITRNEMEQANGRPVPHPWPLLEAARLLDPIPRRSAYVGANLGDVQAAKAANKTVPFLAIGCLAGAPDKDEMQAAFEQHKASMILGHPDHLKELMIG